MGMTIDELIKKSNDYYFIVADGGIWESTGYYSDISCGDKVADLHDLLAIMRKYQKIVQIMERTVDDGTSMYDTLQEIEEVIEDGNDNKQ